MIDGKTVNNLSPKDRDIAMVFQSYALYPSMTVRENISFGLNIRKVPKHEQAQIVDRVSNTLQIHAPARPQARASFPAASASVSRWAARSRAIR